MLKSMQKGRMGKEGGPYWILGLNAGGAWQDSDIKSSPGAGWGFYLGRSIMHNPQNPISADLRFRYMGTLTYGQNATDNNYGNSILNNNFNYLDSAGAAFAHNHESELHDLSLEARINFEELVERVGSCYPYMVVSVSASTMLGSIN